MTFDVGGTLLRPWPSVGHLYAAVAAAHGHSELDPDALNCQFAEAWQRKVNFDHSRAAWRALVRQTFAGLSNTAIMEALFEDLYARFARADAWRLYDDVLPTLHELKARGFQLGLVSNWDERLRDLLEAFQLSRFFEVIAVSFEVGSAKPSPEIFRHTARRLGQAPAAVLHVGDSVADDMQGAEQAGWNARLIDRPAKSGDARRIGALTELLVLLEKHCETEKLH